MDNQHKKAQFFYNFFKETNLSHQTVSNILKKLDSLVRQFLKKKLTDEYLFLIVDAKYIRINPLNKRKKPRFFCIGIREDLTYKILFCTIHYVREALKYAKNRKLLSSLRKRTYNLYKSKTKQEFLNKLNNLKKRLPPKRT
jgi:transposase-like protein